MPLRQSMPSTMLLAAAFCRTVAAPIGRRRSPHPVYENWVTVPMDEHLEASNVLAVASNRLASITNFASMLTTDSRNDVAGLCLLFLSHFLFLPHCIFDEKIFERQCRLHDRLHHSL